MENGWIECFWLLTVWISTHSANNRSRVAYRKSSQISLLHQFQNVTRDDRDFNFHFNIKHASKAWWNIFPETLQFWENGDSRKEYGLLMYPKRSSTLMAVTVYFETIPGMYTRMIYSLGPILFIGRPYTFTKSVEIWLYCNINQSNAKVVCHYGTGMTALIGKILARVVKRVIFYIYACRG